MPYHFDELAAQTAVDFIQLLKHSKGEYAGQFFILQDWQKELVRNLFGWLNEDSTRRYKKLLLEVPRGAGKTQLAAAIGLYMLFLGGDNQPEIYVAAADREQAGIAYRAASDMVHGSPSLHSITKTVPYHKTLTNTLNGGVLKALSSDGSTKHGTAPNCIILDEVHAWVKPGAHELLDALRTGLAKRRNSLEIMISTAGTNEYSIFGRELAYARKVKSGVIKNDSYLVYIFEADPKDPIDSPKTWKKANPSYGVTMFEAEYREHATKALTDPAYLNVFKRLFLNIWTKQETKWITLEAWDKSAGTVNVAELEGKACYAGLDLSTSEDITALVLTFPMDSGEYKVIPYFFIPSDDLHERSVHDNVSYDAWGADPTVNLILSPGNQTDLLVVQDKLNELKARFDIREVAFDRWGANAISQALTSDGFTMVPFGQGNRSMSEPTKELKKLVMTGKLHHGNNPILRWMADCVEIAEENDLVKFVKPKRRKTSNRIDGMVALAMGLGRAMLRPANPTAGLDNLILAYTT